ncbi:MAG: heme-dependent peroxidase [Candidatus Eremiobacteraeota bacterium]|nr:heme-dependent peroxidase [Candidatus Eremiobacteraeota bacterium]
MFSFDRRSWKNSDADVRNRAAREATAELAALKARGDADAGCVELLGDKGDLMLTHYSKTFDGLAQAQRVVDGLELAEYLDPLHSYVSVLELGLYDATGKIHRTLEERALKPHTAEWEAAFDELLDEQSRNPRNAGRLWAPIPQRRYVCFYPMDKKRGESVNWYMLPFVERARLMLDHGKIGRTFHGLVTQVISGSIGYDDYEWGVDLYADDPLVFKKLIYEMRFDEASANYAEFGPFFTGLQFSIDELPRYLDGEILPALAPAQ